MNDATNALNSIIEDRIRERGGWMPFDEFMHTALYEPVHGYYETSRVFGEKGDFITASALGPWLPLAMTDLICWGWESLGKPAQWHLLEQGGGEGELLLAVVKLLQNRDIIQPAKLIAVEQSGWMRRRQKKHYEDASLSIFQVDSLRSITGLENCIFFCNELLDAFPVRCFEYLNRCMFERGVTGAGQGFSWQSARELLSEEPCIDPELISGWPEGYCSEWNPGLASWQQDVASVMQKGYVFCVDYGYPQREYYRPQRYEGTLLAHSRHQTREDVLSAPGSMDITAHVDFSALHRAGLDQNLQASVFMAQGAWMVQSPSVQSHIEAMTNTPEWARESANIKRLLMPFGMGELFKLFIQAFHASVTPPPFLKDFNRIDAL